jgi:hypothetical protein
VERNEVNLTEKHRSLEIMLRNENEKMEQLMRKARELEE